MEQQYPYFLKALLALSDFGSSMTIPRNSIAFPVNSLPTNFSFQEALFIFVLTLPILCQKLRTVEQWKCCMVGRTQGANYGSTCQLSTHAMESKKGTRPPWKQAVELLGIDSQHQALVKTRVIKLGADQAWALLLVLWGIYLKKKTWGKMWILKTLLQS